MTVRELIARLSEFDLDAEVVIEDADTLWELRLTKIENSEGGFVSLSGDYGDVVSK